MTINFSLEPFTPTPSGWTATIVNSVMIQKIRQLPVGYTYTLEEDETITPDLVSQLFYDSPHYAWVVMVYNNFLDIRELSAKNLTSDVNSNYAKFSFILDNPTIKLYTLDILTVNSKVYRTTSCTNQNLFGVIETLADNYIEISTDNSIIYKSTFTNFKAIPQSIVTKEIRLPDKIHLMNLVTSIVDQGD